MRLLKSMAWGILATMLLAFSVNAEEGKDDSNRLLPGSRPMENDQWQKIRQERFCKDSNKEETSVSVERSKWEAASILKQDSQEASTASTSIYYTSHSGAYHSPWSISFLGDIVELEDGSIWSIANGDRYKTLNWLMSDLVVLTANHDWFSSYLFRITNQNTGVSVKCNMTFGPIYNGLYTHWIVAINYYTQEIVLEDGSIWLITGYDSSTFSQWLLNDTIIIGINDSFLSSTKPNILINVNTLTYVRAICTW